MHWEGEKFKKTAGSTSRTYLTWKPLGCIQTLKMWLDVVWCQHGNNFLALFEWCRLKLHSALRSLGRPISNVATSSLSVSGSNANKRRTRSDLLRLKSMKRASNWRCVCVSSMEVFPCTMRNSSLKFGSCAICLMWSFCRCCRPLLAISGSSIYSFVLHCDVSQLRCQFDWIFSRQGRPWGHEGRSIRMASILRSVQAWEWTTIAMAKHQSTFKLLLDFFCLCSVICRGGGFFCNRLSRGFILYSSYIAMFLRLCF